MMKFTEGQSVKVKMGVLCPDDPEFDLGGWQGRIRHIDDDAGETIIGISWDSVTLREMPERYIEKSEEEGMDWASMYLAPSDVDVVEPRDTEEETENVKDELQGRFKWFGMGEEGLRIQSVVDSAKSDDPLGTEDAWEKHLRENLQFPIDCVISEYQERGPLRQGDQVKVIGIELSDDLYGVIVSCRVGRKRYSFPLVDLEAVDETSDNARYISDYGTWFCNR